MSPQVTLHRVLAFCLQNAPYRRFLMPTRYTFMFLRPEFTTFLYTCLRLAWSPSRSCLQGLASTPTTWWSRGPHSVEHTVHPQNPRLGRWSCGAFVGEGLWSRFRVQVSGLRCLRHPSASVGLNLFLFLGFLVRFHPLRRVLLAM